MLLETLEATLSIYKLIFFGIRIYEKNAKMYQEAVHLGRKVVFNSAYPS